MVMTEHSSSHPVMGFTTAGPTVEAVSFYFDCGMWKTATTNTSSL